ncbi:hypothetical protein [Pseudoalteromonas maricaloris]|uniref:restriction endonuclease-related protein n=1 Tax=Pseudoalteromonas maricaloris TaxID=184924 RepID=UPI003C247E8C
MKTRDMKAQEALAMSAKAATLWQRLNDKDPLVSAHLFMGHISHTIAYINSISSKPITSVEEFINNLRQPICEWLPVPDAFTLINRFGVTEFAEDIVSESSGNLIDELNQKQIKDAKDRLASMPDGDLHYTRFRKGLIENPVAQPKSIHSFLNITGCNFRDLYEPLPSNVLLDGTSDYFPCPRCKWPMQIKKGEIVRCASNQCVKEGAHYSLSKGKLSSLGALPAPASEDGVSCYRLVRGIWRHTVLSGLSELELANKLEQLPGVTVVMWPFVDEFDLEVTYDSGDSMAKHTWRVDVKDWSRESRLAANIQGHSHYQELCYVIPDYRRKQLKYLEERFKSSPMITFHTSSKFVQMVKKYIKRLSNEPF